MVKRCPYEGCRHEWEPSWRHCPNCGTDAMPSLPRPLGCEHAFEIVGPFCVRCGWDSEAPFGLQPGVRRVVGVLVLVLAGGLLAGDALLIASGRRESVRLGAYLTAPLLALLVVVSRLLVPRRAERTR